MIPKPTAYTEEFTAVSKSLTQTFMELVGLLNRTGYTAAATTVAELADRTSDALKAASMVAEVYVR